MTEAAAKHAKKQPITCRPADFLRPEWDELRTQALALDGCNGSDEDVLTFAMFPQVAPKFFAHRAEGPKNVGRNPDEKPPASGAAGSGDQSRQPVSNRVTYNVRVGGKSHQVTVEPA